MFSINSQFAGLSITLRSHQRQERWAHNMPTAPCLLGRIAPYVHGSYPPPPATPQQPGKHNPPICTLVRAGAPAVCACWAAVSRTSAACGWAAAACGRAPAAALAAAAAPAAAPVMIIVTVPASTAEEQT
jgi:hypothetical protein